MDQTGISWGLSCCCCLVTQLYLTLWDPMDCNPPGSSVHGISQARILEWVAISLSRGSSQPRDQTQVSYVAGRFFTIWAIWEAHCGLTQLSYLWKTVASWSLEPFFVGIYFCAGHCALLLIPIVLLNLDCVLLFLLYRWNWSLGRWGLTWFHGPRREVRVSNKFYPSSNQIRTERWTRCMPIPLPVLKSILLIQIWFTKANLMGHIQLTH